MSDAPWAKLFHGDCLDILPRLRAGCIDAIICDPPYGTTQCRWDAVIPFDRMWAKLLRVAKPNAAICLCSAQPFTSALIMSNPKLWRHEWVWIKNRGSNFANTVREPFKEHETVQVFSRGKWTYNKQMQARTGKGKDRAAYVFTARSKTGNTENYGAFAGVPEVQNASPERVPSSWQKWNTEVGLHPQQKPVAMMAYLVRTYTNPGEIVLDFTMGSASTGEACILEGRNFIGIEKYAEHFATAERRIFGVDKEEAAD